MLVLRILLAVVLAGMLLLVFSRDESGRTMDGEAAPVVEPATLVAVPTEVEPPDAVASLVRPPAAAAPIPKHVLKGKWPTSRRMVFEYHAVGGGRTASVAADLDSFDRAELKVVFGLTILPGEFGGHEGVMEIRELLIRVMEKDRSKLDFDSRRTGFTRNASVNALRQSIGSRFIYLWNGNGTLLKVIGMERLHASLKEQIPDVMWLSLAGYFSDHTLAKLMAIHRGLPDRPKQIGEIWRQHEQVRMLSAGVGCTVRQAYTLRGRRDNEPAGPWEIGQEGEIEYRASSPDALRQILGGPGDRSSGMVWYDSGLGIVTEAKGSNEFNLGTRRSGGGTMDFKRTESFRFRLLRIETVTAAGSG